MCCQSFNTFIDTQGEIDIAQQFNKFWDWFLIDCGISEIKLTNFFRQSKMFLSKTRSNIRDDDRMSFQIYSPQIQAVDYICWMAMVR